MPENITFIPGSLSPNPCYTSEQARYNAYIAALQGYIDSPSNILIQQTTPDPDDRSKVWVQVDGSNRITGIYTFANGSWQTQYFPPSVSLPGVVLDYYGEMGSIVAPYYLCNGQTITGAINGTLVTPDLMGKVILGSGQATGGSNFPHRSTGGEETNVLTIPKIPIHNHASADGTDFLVQGGGAGNTSGSGSVTTKSTTASTGGGEAHNNLQPYMAMYKIMLWY